MLQDGIKELILVRGLPGAGKRTIVNLLMSAIDDRNNIKSISPIGFEQKEEDVNSTEETTSVNDVRRDCQLIVSKWMYNGVQVIIVYDYFVKNEHLKPYYDLADKFKYRVHSVVVENRHKYIPKQYPSDIEMHAKIDLSLSPVLKKERD